MGQKVSPIGMRVGVIRDWDSRWYAEKDYGKLLLEDVKIREFFGKDKVCKDAYISRVEIERTSNEVKLIVRCARPGAIVAKGEKDSDNVETIKKKIGKLTKRDPKTIKMDIVQIANPDLDAHFVARGIAEKLEQRQSFRTVQKKAIQQTMKAGAKGIKTIVSGRLGGADIARGEGYSEGVTPLHTLRSDIDYAWVEAHTTYGKLGVKVWICRGEVLPGEMVKEPEAPKMPMNRGPRRPRGDRPARRPAANTAAKKEAAPVAEKATETTEGGN